MAALSQLFWWFLNDESIGLLASLVTWISQMPQFVLESEIPKVLTQNPIFIFFLQECLIFFFFFLYKNFINHFIGIHFHNSKNCVKKNYTGFIVRKSDKNNCMHFFFRLFESYLNSYHWFVSSDKNIMLAWRHLWCYLVTFVVMS